MNRLAELRKAACTWALYKDSSASYRLLVALAYHMARESAMQDRRKFWADSPQISGRFSAKILKKPLIILHKCSIISM